MMTPPGQNTSQPGQRPLVPRFTSIRTDARGHVTRDDRKRATHNEGKNKTPVLLSLESAIRNHEVLGKYLVDH